MSSSPGPGPRPDRRSERARQAILNAADDLLVEVGYAGVTIEGIAARAGVGKQTIYRWWSSKADVLMDNFSADARSELALPDLGSVRADLTAYLRQLALFLTEAPAGAVLLALIGQAQHDRSMAAAFRGSQLAEHRERERELLARGIERGELPADLDVDTGLAELVGPLYYRVLVTGEPVDPTFTDALVNSFLRTACVLRHARFQARHIRHFSIRLQLLPDASATHNRAYRTVKWSERRATGVALRMRAGGPRFDGFDHEVYC